MNNIPEFHLQFDDKTKSIMWSSDEQIKNIGIEEILAYYAGTLTSRGLMDQIKQHVQNHLLQLPYL